MIGNRTIAEQPGPFAGRKGSVPGKHPPFRHLLRLVIAAAVLLIIVLGIITGYVEKWLWMRQLNYAGIFWTLLSGSVERRRFPRGWPGREARQFARSRCARAGRYRFFS